MILADTSAWVEFLRGSGSPAHHRIRDLLERGEGLCTTETVIMEILAGASTGRDVADLRDLLNSIELVPCDGLADHETAAALYRQCRAAGATIRTMTDCLIAAIAQRIGASVLHRDRDFDALAEHCGLRVVRPA